MGKKPQRPAPPSAPAQQDDELIRAADFVSVRLDVHFQNLLSGSGVVPAEQVTLDELGDKALVLGLPAGSCNVSHGVMIEIARADASARKGAPVLKATGKVRGIEKLDEDDDKRVRAHIDLVQYDEESWERLLALFSGRQLEINRFLAAVRG
ncbi:MAG: hypothetical protein HY075_10460 [Deltaproteobacteria bacterium]|nr:hypothetical protein [Deltaproteobacteria bacterium]